MHKMVDYDRKDFDFAVSRIKKNLAINQPKKYFMFNEIEDKADHIFENETEVTES